MIRTTIFALLLLTALLPIRAQAAPLGVHWTRCYFHLDWATMRHVTAKECAHYRMPKSPGHSIGHWTEMRYVSPHVRTWVKYPEFAKPAPARTEAVSGSYQATWLVTYYLPTGNPMANGQMPFIGAAACGFDVRLGARVYVPGIGTLTCLDRIGYDPYRHVDVFGQPLGTGYRTVTVFP